MKHSRSFWRWLIVWARAGALAEAREKRIMRENLETWDRYHRQFIIKSERKESRRYDSPSADESSTVGGYGSDSGDGSVF